MASSNERLRMRHPVPGAHGGGLYVSGLQRARLLDATFAVVAEVGFRGIALRAVAERAGVSSKTFYDLLSRRLRRLVFVEALGAGPRVLERRVQVLGVLQGAVDLGRAGVKAGRELPPLSAEGVVGAAFGVIHTRLLERRPEPLTELLNPLMATIVLPYRGRGAAARELARPISKAGPRTLPEGLGLLPADKSRFSGPAGRTSGSRAGRSYRSGAAALRCLFRHSNSERRGTRRSKAFSKHSDDHPQKGIRMSKPLNALTSLLSRLGGAGPARSRVPSGTGALKISRGSGAPTRLVLSLLAATLGALAFTAAPALAVQEKPELTVEDSTAVVAAPSTEALLRGVLNPAGAGEAGTYKFLYKASKTGVCTGGSETTEGLSLSGERQEPAEPISGLSPGTEYAVCLRVENNAKTESATSAPVTFTTAIKPETPVTEAPEKVGATSWKLQGELNPGSTAKNGYLFAFSTSGECLAGSRSEPGSEVEASKRKVSSVVTLEPLREYTVCVVSTNADGEETVGNAVKVTTPAAPPAIESESVSSINAGGAHLEGVVNPNNQLTECKFQYGTEPLLATGTTTASCEPASFPASFGGRGVGLNVSGLTQDTTYYYRVLATNATGTAPVTIAHFATALPPQTPEKAKASGVVATTATLHGVLNPAAARAKEPGSDEFRYRQSTTECEGENEKAVGATTAPGLLAKEPAQATVTELLPGAAYTFCLLVRNEAGEEALGPPETLTTPAQAPAIEGEFSTGVRSSSATLHAKIDPRGSATEYRFLYSPCTGGGECSIPIPDEAIGSGDAGVEVEQHIQGLTAGQSYHYHVVAINGVGEERGEALAFVTQAGSGEAGLPDGRGWELVSPVNDYGAQIFALGDIGGDEILDQASGDGGAMTYLALTPTEKNPQGYTSNVQVLSKHGVGGWSSEDIATPNVTTGGGKRGGVHNDSAGGSEYWMFSEDLSLGYLFQSYTLNFAQVPLLSSLASERTPYVRRQSLCEAQATASECYLPLVTGKPGYADVPPGTQFGGEEESEFSLEGATPDLTHIVFSYKGGASLTSTPAGGSSFGALYEWSADKPPAERLQLVNVLPASEGGQVANSEWLTLGAFSGEEASIARGAISPDGSRVFWSTGHPSQVLYMRDLAKGETLRIGDGTFEFTTGGGANVFYNSTTSPYGTGDLMECEIVEEAGALACKTRDLTPGGGLLPTVPAVSEDGSYVYFVANGVLAAGASLGECNHSVTEVTQSERCNLYVLHDGVTRFIASLSGEDFKDWGNISFQAEGLQQVTMRTSRDGRYLAFMSDLPLTGYDNRDARSGRLDQEVYRYDASSARLVCASCNPTGARPVGVEVTVGGKELLQTDLGDGTWIAGYIPEWTTARYQSRYLSDSGRLFFDSPDALVPQDINGTEDVYEYEPVGAGSCAAAGATFSAASDGCVGLISSGSSPEESVFLDASETGDDVFFMTSAKLVSQDTQTGFAVYDAHVCATGWPCAGAPESTPACTTADSCRATPTPQPAIFGSPASATFSGAGNVTPSGGAPPPTKPKAKPLTRAQKLARALAVCHRKRRKKPRDACERQAKKRSAVKASRPSSKASKGGSR
jgi:hypothetical protein